MRIVVRIILAGIMVISIAGLAPAAEPPAGPAPSETVAEHTPEAAPPAVWPPGLLMDLLGPARKPLDSIGFRTWGFVEGGFTGRLTGGQHPLPLRGFEARRPDNLRLQQLRMTFDRPYDSAKPVDAGFRIDGLFGGDALLTHSPGLFDKAGHGQSDAWADLTQMYLQAWIKTGKESGLEITGGKFVTTHGAEVIDAVGNALFSHSLLFNFAIPFTHTGVKVNAIFNPQVSAYVAVVRGWEVFEDNNDAMSLMTGGALSSKEQIDGHARTTLALNVITGPEQPKNVSNYRTLSDIVLTHWWTSKLSQTLNFDYATEQAATHTGGAAHWYGVAHYLTYLCNEYVSPTWRVEWFRDQDGVRTGTAANYYENTWGLAITPLPNHPVFKNLVVRPELRWDFADRAAFGDTHFNQMTLAFDVIFKF